jgi:hypothetical protein
VEINLPPPAVDSEDGIGSVFGIRADDKAREPEVIQDLLLKRRHRDLLIRKEAAEKWGISERRIQKLCENGRISGIIRFVRVWAISKDAEKPVDARFKSERNKKF